MSIAPERISDLGSAEAVLRFQAGHDDLADAFEASKDVTLALAVLVTGPFAQARAAVDIMCCMASWAVGLHGPGVGDTADVAKWFRVQAVVASTRELIDSDLVSAAYPFARSGYSTAQMDLDRYIERFGRDAAMPALVKAYQVATVLDSVPMPTADCRDTMAVGRIADTLVLNEHFGLRVWSRSALRLQLVHDVRCVVQAVENDWSRAHYRARDYEGHVEPAYDALGAFKAARSRRYFGSVK